MSHPYTWFETGYGDFVSCECCQAEAPLREFSTFEKVTNTRSRKTLLCEVCSSTLISNRWQYSHSNPGDWEASRKETTIAAVANVALRMLGAFESAPVETLPPDDETDHVQGEQE